MIGYGDDSVENQFQTLRDIIAKRRNDKVLPLLYVDSLSELLVAQPYRRDEHDDNTIKRTKIDQNENESCLYSLDIRRFSDADLNRVTTMYHDRWLHLLVVYRHLRNIEKSNDGRLSGQDNQETVRRTAEDDTTVGTNVGDDDRNSSATRIDGKRVKKTKTVNDDSATTLFDSINRRNGFIGCSWGSDERAEFDYLVRFFRNELDYAPSNEKMAVSEVYDRLNIINRIMADKLNSNVCRV